MMIMVTIFFTVQSDSLSSHQQDQRRIIFRNQLPNHPTCLWNGGDDGNDDDEDEISDEIYHAQNNAEDIAQVRGEGFLVNDDNNSVPENIPGANAVPVAVKESGLSLDQEWGWDNTCIDRRTAIITRMLE